MKSGLPYVNFAVMSHRENDVLKQRVMGSIYSPAGGKVRAWVIDEDLLMKSMILVGRKSYHIQDIMKKFQCRMGRMYIIQFYLNS